MEVWIRCLVVGSEAVVLVHDGHGLLPRVGHGEVGADRRDLGLQVGDEAVALDEDGIDYGTEAFAVFGGLVFLRGAACPDPRSYASRDAVAQGLVPRTTWTRLKRPALPGDAKVRVAGVDATEVARVGARVAL